MKLILLILMALSTGAFAQRTQTINADCLRMGLNGVCIEKAEFETLSGVTSSIQNQLDAKSDDLAIQGQITGIESAISNIDNTSDLNKPISTATQAALDDKANDAEVLHQTGDEEASGTKTFTGKLVTQSTINGSIPCPSMTETQRNAITSPVAGDCVFNSTTNSLNVFNGTLWKAAGGGLSAWETAFSYSVGDIVIESDKIYQAFSAHTSGTFAVDLAAGKWTRLNNEIGIGSQSGGMVPSIKTLVTPNNQVTDMGSNIALIETGNSNYLANPGIEAQTMTEFVAYADTAGVAPVDGTGGTANITVEASTVSPLRGLKSLLITKDTVNRQGEGFSTDFTIDPADRTKIVDISFDYETSANYADGDIRIYIYDITNLKLIELVNRDLLASANGTYRGFFQASPDSVNYRLIGHVASVSTLDYTVKLDEVKVSPQAPRVTGAVVTDWKDCVTTVNNVTIGNGTLSCKIKRDGDSALFQIGLILGSTSSVTGSISFNYPSGLSADMAKVLFPLMFDASEILDSDVVTNRQVGQVRVNASSIQPLTNQASAINATTPFTWATGDRITFTTKPIPIQGWSSNMVLSEDAGNREVRVVASGNGGTAITTNVTNVDFTKVEDTTSSWSGSEFTAPETKTYIFDGAIRTTANVSAYIVGYTTPVGGSPVATHTIGSFVSQDMGKFVAIVPLKKGEKFSIRIGAVVTLNNSIFHRLTIKEFSSPQTIAASETVAVRATSTTGQTITNAETANIIWNSKNFDSHNALNIANGVFTAPLSGYYKVTAAIKFQSAASAVGNFVFTGIRKNGVLFSTGFYDLAESTTTVIRNSTVTDLIYLSKGETLSIVGRNNRTGGSTSLDTLDTSNYVSITRVGN